MRRISGKMNSVSDAKVQLLLSTMWIFVILNMIYADILGMLRPGYLEALDRISQELTGSAVLLFAIFMEMVIVMVPLSRFLHRTANRWVHFVVIPLSILWVVVPSFIPSLGDSTPLSYMFFAAVETATMLAMLWCVWNWRRLDPLTLEKIRERKDLKEIGNIEPWTVPTRLLNSDSICYLVGCGENISFDLSLIDTFGCDVYGFDPTPKSIAYVKDAAGQNPKYHFYEVGVWDKEDTLKFFVPRNPNHVSHSLLNLQKTDDYILLKVKRLSQLMKELDHEHIDLLKIDIEGAEYKVIESIIKDKIDIKILCVEYDEGHHPLDANYKDRIRTSVHSLITEGYRLVFMRDRSNYTFVKKS